MAARGRALGRRRPRPGAVAAGGVALGGAEGGPKAGERPGRKIGPAGPHRRLDMIRIRVQQIGVVTGRAGRCTLRGKPC